MDKDIKCLYDAITAINEQLRIQALAIKEFLTLNEVCEVFSLKKQTMYKLTSARLIPYYKPNGKLIYFKRSDIEQWIEKGLLGTIKSLV